MSFEGLGISIGLLLIVGLWIGAPLLLRRSPEMALAGMKNQPRERMMAAYERVLENLRDMEEDFQIGKIAEADYNYEREVLVQRGVQILAEMDKLTAQAAPHKARLSASKLDADVDQQIEQAVAAYRRKNATRKGTSA